MITLFLVYISFFKDLSESSILSIHCHILWLLLELIKCIILFPSESINFKLALLLRKKSTASTEPCMHATCIGVS